MVGVKDCAVVSRLTAVTTAKPVSFEHVKAKPDCYLGADARLSLEKCLPTLFHESDDALRRVMGPADHGRWRTDDGKSLANVTDELNSASNDIY